MLVLCFGLSFSFYKFLFLIYTISVHLGEFFFTNSNTDSITTESILRPLEYSLLVDNTTIIFITKIIQLRR